MIYEGGLTFDSEQPSKFLKIPNHIAAHNFGNAVLDRLRDYKSLRRAFRKLSATGAPDRVLAVYLCLLRRLDFDDDAFRKSERDHRDRLQMVMFDNPALNVSDKFKVEGVRITHQLQLAAADMHAGLWTAWVSRLAH
jgi:hypothetical protein